MGIAPTILWGRQRRSFTRDGLTINDPDWLAYDFALLTLLDEWEAGLCACGQPRTSHDGKTAFDYAAASVSCPLMEARAIAQARQAKRDGHKQAKADPSSWRWWITLPIQAMRDFAAHERARKQPIPKE